MLSHFQHLLKLNLSVVDLCYGGWHLNQTSCLHNKIGMIVPKTFIGSYKCTFAEYFHHTIDIQIEEPYSAAMQDSSAPVAGRTIGKMQSASLLRAFISSDK